MGKRKERDGPGLTMGRRGRGGGALRPVSHPVYRRSLSVWKVDRTVVLETGPEGSVGVDEVPRDSRTNVTTVNIVLHSIQE